MAMAQGFSTATKYISVPVSFLGSLLQDIHSMAELKCTLRALALIHQRRSRRRWITLTELISDSILINALEQEPGGATENIYKGVNQAAKRGTLLLRHQQKGNQKQTLIFLNDPPGRHAQAHLVPGYVAQETLELLAGEINTDSSLNIFSLYENYLGPLTPLLAEELKEAESVYPWPWIREAFQEAEGMNRRNWRYIARILERWATEGKNDGEPRRHSKEVDRKEYLRRYGHLTR